MIDSRPLGGRVPVGEFSFRLAAMANEFSRKRVWVTPVWSSIGPNADPEGDVLRAGYEDFIVAEAGKRWNLGPDLHFMSSTEFLSWDGVHANQDGQNAYARAIADTVPFLVPEPSTASLAGLGLLALGAIAGRRQR
jgi:MYXO-CTERM domain-containing protein